MVYRIMIEEIGTHEFDVEADSLDEAIEIGKEVYEDIPDAEVSYRQIKACGPDEDGEEVETEWEEL